MRTATQRLVTALAAASLLVVVTPAVGAGVYDPPAPPPPAPAPAAEPAPAPQASPAQVSAPRSLRPKAATPRVPERCRKTELDMPGPMNRVRAWNARLIATTGLRRRPSLAVRPFRRLSPLTTHGDTAVLLVTGRACDRSNRVWLRVLVPVRPNNTNAWILREQVVVERNAYRIEVDQRTRRLTLFRSGRRVFRVPVAVGAPSTPTPSGRFAIAETAVTNSPGHFLGPVVLPATGFSEVLNEYAGGNGRFALHGTSVPQFIGTRASHGCIRLHNTDILRLSRLARAGTPVIITPP